MVKHWFRNTLFKERQRNKDSPYNFNNPPSTTLNLEEYERTGQAKVTPLVEGGDSHGMSQQQQQQQSQNHQQQTSSIQQQQQQSQSSQQFQQQHHQLTQMMLQSQQEVIQQFRHQQQDNRPLSHPSSTTSERGDIHIKSEPADDTGNNDTDSMIKHEHDQEQNSLHSQHQQNLFYNSFETKSESGSSEILSRPQTPNSSSYNNLNEIMSQQIENMPLSSMSNMGNLNNMGPPKKFQMNKIFEKGNFETNSNSSNSSTSSGKRANRTRFTDYQIKVLQEFFENNSYPKDSDLEYLSKLLLLSPRVIVVWFQVSL